MTFSGRPIAITLIIGIFKSEIWGAKRGKMCTMGITANV